MANLTVYPDPSVETTSVDGYTQRAGTNLTWADIHDGVGTAANDNGTSSDAPVITAGTTSGRWSTIRRLITLFDTSALPDTATISAATYSLYYTSVFDNATLNQGVRVVTSTPASNTAVVTTDYPNIGTVAQATDVDLGAITINQYNDFALNATGISNISLTSISKFGLRMTGDADNTAPTWASAGEAGGTIINAETADTTTDPKLSINYSTVVGPANLKTYNTNATANIKSINTNLIANIKSLNTNV